MRLGSVVKLIFNGTGQSKANDTTKPSSALSKLGLVFERARRLCSHMHSKRVAGVPSQWHYPTSVERRWGHEVRPQRDNNYNFFFFFLFRVLQTALGGRSHTGAPRCR
eukprot:TRINITY_DN44233_c0_g1_i1.p1 TRINITY_DN44233_c0_g1~~TRINITY_DN44233_c0_g1_i1.p1  ORF type:complete len:115 (-),score=2.57 TRINITY_DN44233_c0_g1_i1:31-354(-)